MTPEQIIQILAGSPAEAFKEVEHEFTEVQLGAFLAILKMIQYDRERK